MDIEKKLSIIFNACEDKNAINIKILKINELTSIADYFVIASGNSSNQVMAIADEVEEKVLKEEKIDFSKEGYKSGRWILLDFNDIIVHVFHKEQREFYDLERLWSDGEEINIK